MDSEYVKGKTDMNPLRQGELGRIVNHVNYEGVIVARGADSYTVVHLSGCTCIKLYWTWDAAFFKRNIAVERISEEDKIVLTNKKDDYNE